jgi:hypothetical protein
VEAERNAAELHLLPGFRSIWRRTLARLTTALNRSPSNTMAASHTLVSATKMPPSSSAAGPTGTPRGMNPGKKLMKKMPTWG